jgi:cation:H+ antiporter
VNATAFAFALGAASSLAASWLLVSRIERLGGRLGVTDAMLGLIAALAADAPEITSAVSALSSHQEEVGAGVVMGSNVFNLAALLGLGAVAAGWVALHRRVVLLTGAVSLWIALVSILVVLGWLGPGAALVFVLAALGPYTFLAASRRRSRLGAWLSAAMSEEELEIRTALIPSSNRVDIPVAIVALAVVVASSVVMERAATSLGRHFSLSNIVVGAVVLAAVTSLPNAVAAIYLARRGRGTAMLSTALNSNALNIAVGLLVPASIIGLGAITSREVFVALWYFGLTAVVLALAYRDRGLRRHSGMVVLVAYALFVATLIPVASGHLTPSVLVVPAVLVLAWTTIVMITPRRRIPAAAQGRARGGGHRQGQRAGRGTGAESWRETGAVPRPEETS